jgi:hypothetical protein
LGTHTFTTLSLPNFVPGDISLWWNKLSLHCIKFGWA